jgi:glucuronoarabinoxylan endo-1,4-beta-xylanase
LVVALAAVVAACTPENPDNPGTGGSPPVGGSPGNGGTATGGRSTGGSATAGSTTGGRATGGATSSGGTGAGPTCGSGIVVNPATTYQTMDGFGIADVWQAKSTSTAAQRTLFWDPVNGIGMTILRVGIENNGQIMGDAAFVDAPEVVKYGGKVWAAPWSPPASYKDNNSTTNGGHLNTDMYETWTSTLAAFPAYFKQNAGVDLWGLSAQNEPDYVATWASCIFSASQMNAFIKVLGPKLKALDPPVRLLAAEPDVWSHLWDNGDRYGVAIEGDATVSSLVDVLATHDYGSNVASTTRPSPPASVKHPIWQTEATYTAGAAIGPALDFARSIYAGVTSGGASGWVYWWTPSFLDGGSTSSPPKRVYTMGNFSKFVRPGYVRVGVTGQPSSLQMVAFGNPSDNTTVLVVLNSGSSSQNISVCVSTNASPSQVTPWVTSASDNLASKTAIPLSGGSFSATIAAQSVTTFVGKP